MTELILQLILMGSLASIVYLMATAVPRVGETGDKHTGNSKNGSQIPLDKIDVMLEKLRNKSLRRLKILVMKADNTISKQLNKDE